MATIYRVATGATVTTPSKGSTSPVKRKRRIKRRISDIIGSKPPLDLPSRTTGINPYTGKRQPGVFKPRNPTEANLIRLQNKARFESIRRPRQPIMGGPPNTNPIRFGPYRPPPTVGSKDLIKMRNKIKKRLKDNRNKTRSLMGGT